MRTLVCARPGMMKGEACQKIKLTVNQRSEPACCPRRADKGADDYGGATRTEQTRQLDSVKTLGLNNHVIWHFDQ